MTRKSPLISKTTKSNQSIIQGNESSSIGVLQIHIDRADRVEINGNKSSISSQEDLKQLDEGLKYVARYQGDSEVLNGEYHDQINYARDLINKYKPQSAFDYLIELEKKKWNRFDNILKFRLKAYIGAALLGIGKSIEAAKAFIEAKQYNPKDEKALLNYALGNLFLQKFEEVVKTARKVIKENPANTQAYSLLIQGLSSSITFEEILLQVPDSIKDDPEVSMALGFVAYKKDEYDQAISWNEKAIDKKGDLIEAKTTLANILLDSVIHNKPLTDLELVSSQEIEIIQRSIQLYSEIWDLIKDSELASYQVQCLSNRSLAYRILGDFDSALKDQELALSLEPENAQFILLKASLLYEKGDYPGAEVLLTPIKDNSQVPSASLLLSEVLKAQGKIGDAISLIKLKIAEELEEPLDREYRRYLINLYLSIEKSDEAEKVAEDLDVEHIVNFASKASIFRKKGDDKGARDILIQGLAKIDQDSKLAEILALAYELYWIKDFENASLLLEKVIDPSVDNELTRRLLNCYHHLGNDQAILDVCKKLRGKNGVIKDLTELELSILEEIGDVESAEHLSKEHLSTFQDDVSIKVRLATNLYRQQKIEELKTFLLTEFEFELLPLNARVQLAQLYEITGSSLKAIDLMYETRRDFFKESEAHSRYIAVFFAREKSLDLVSSEVEPNTAVQIEEMNGSKRWYVLEERENSDLAKNELDIGSALAKSLLGKKVGDTVVLNGNSIQEKKATIIEIKHKFVYALHESTSIFNTLFPDDGSFFALDLKIEDKKENIPNEFLKMLDAQSERHQVIIDIYKQGQTPVSVLARLLGRGIIETWGYLINREDVGLRSCLGTQPEIDQALRKISENKKSLTVDLISLLTIHGINLADKLVECYGKLNIARSSLDEILDVLTIRKAFTSDGYLAAGKENGVYVKEEVTQEKLNENTEYLESIFKWAEKNCNIIPLRTPLSFNSQKKELLIDMIGKSSLDTLGIAKQQESILISDDYWLRAFAKTEFNIDGIWIQVLISKAVDEGIISKVEYEKAVVKLACSNYRYTAISSDTLFEAAKQADWQPKGAFSKVASLLGGREADLHSSMIVVEDFIVKLYMDSIYLPTTQSLLLLTLQYAIPATLTEKTIKILINRLKRRLYFAPDRAKELEAILRKWSGIRFYS